MMSARRVDIVNETDVRLSEGLLRQIAETALASEQAEGQVVIALVDALVIEELNVRYRREEGPTDVLSFPASTDDEWPDPVPPDAAEAPLAELGDLVVAPDIVRQYAAEEGNSWDRQLAWTVIHGILHLLGQDHEADEGEMRAHEQVLLRSVEDLVAANGSLVKPAEDASSG
jgi:rRNA maturation RNase YbeY